MEQPTGTQNRNGHDQQGAWDGFRDPVGMGTGLGFGPDFIEQFFGAGKTPLELWTRAVIDEDEQADLLDLFLIGLETRNENITFYVGTYLMSTVGKDGRGRSDALAATPWSRAGLFNAMKDLTGIGKGKD